MSILSEIDHFTNYNDIYEEEALGFLSHGDEQFSWARDGKFLRGSFSKHRQTNPPSGYICKLCGVPGHWIQQCPEQHNYPKISYWKVKAPPEGYICRLCGVRGHWIQKCPTAPKLPEHHALIEEEYQEEFLKITKSPFMPLSQNDSLHANADPWLNPFSFEKQDQWPTDLSFSINDTEQKKEIIKRELSNKQDFATNPFQLGTLFDPSYLDLEDSSVLTMSNVDSYDERALSQMIFSLTRENVQVQILKDIYGNPSGQARISCPNSTCCMKILKTLNGQTIPGSDQVFDLSRGDGTWSNRHSTGQKIDLSWASLADLEKQKEREKETSFSIFVGNLPLNIDRTTLFHTFHEKYPSVTCARVMHDTASGISKGYGFVIFSDEKEQQIAMIEMQGQYCGERPMRLNIAKRKTL